MVNDVKWNYIIKIDMHNVTQQQQQLISLFDLVRDQ
jgi:hypothetical protein